MANLINWNHDFSVHNEIIDAQHKKLVDIINELHTSLEEGKSQQDLQKIVDDLILFIIEHFKTEEHFMVKASYVFFKEHKQEHDDLVRQALALQAGYRSGKIEITKDILDFLHVWLVKHIEGSDTKLIGKI
jgi:hemerythrin-like metal-binding protein